MFLPFFSTVVPCQGPYCSNIFGYGRDDRTYYRLLSYSQPNYGICRYGKPCTTLQNNYYGATVPPPPAYPDSEAAGGFAIFFHSVTCIAHFALFIMYTVVDCCETSNPKRTIRVIFATSIIATASLFLAFLVALRIFTETNATTLEGAFWWTFANVILSAFCVIGAYRYTGGKNVPPPNPASYGNPDINGPSPTIVVVQQGPNGTLIPVHNAGLMSPPTQQPIVAVEATSSALMTVAHPPGTYSLLVHGVGNFPVKAIVQATTFGDLVLALKAQLGINQEFMILYTDPDFGKTAQLRDLSSLSQKAEITLQFQNPSI